LILYVYSLLLVRERSLGLITIDKGHRARRG